MVSFSKHPRGKRQNFSLSLSTRSILVYLPIFLFCYVATIHLLVRIRENSNGKSDTNGTSTDTLQLRAYNSRQQSLTEQDVRGDDTPTIGVASTVTGCGESPFQDGAAVLKYSLDRHSAANGNGRYNYQTYIFYHPNATSCVLPLQALGFTLIKRATPIRVEEIQGEELRERIVKNGCCGEKELIKLEAYRLVQHPLVIHVDLDVLILKPMDDVIDFMLHPTTRQYNLQKVPLMWPEKPIPNDIQLLFTKDYNMVGPKRRDKPFQGGFFIIKPSLEAYDEFIRIVKEGDYHVKGGWGKKVGPFYGGMTIQGLLPYFYEHLHPGRAVELNRCIYNNMNDNPFMERKNGEKRCRTDQESCEDCRFRPKEDVVTFHFTICQKPWSCLSFRSQQDKFKLCREMNHEWFAYRSKLEQTYRIAVWASVTIEMRGWCTYDELE